MSFIDDMRKVSKNIEADLEQLGKEIKFSLFRQVIETTNVKSGTAKRNWQLTDDSPAVGAITATDPTPMGTMSPERYAELLRVKGIGVSYLTNNLGYVQYLEERYGFVDKAIINARRNLEAKGL